MKRLTEIERLNAKFESEGIEFEFDKRTKELNVYTISLSATNWEYECMYIERRYILDGAYDLHIANMIAENK